MKIKKLCLALILGIVLSACGSSSPEDIALDFTKKVYKGDAAILDYFDFDLKEAKESEKEFINGKIRAMVAERKEEADEKGGVKEIIIGEKDIRGDRARIKITTIFKDDSNSTRSIPLIKKDGKWLIGK